MTYLMAIQGEEKLIIPITAEDYQEGNCVKLCL
jgi:hypothetical protein